MERVYVHFVFVRRWFIRKSKPFTKKEPFRKRPSCHFLTGLYGLEIHNTKLASWWSNNLNSQAVSCSSAGKRQATRATTRGLTLYQTRYLYTGVADGRVKVGNFAVAGANSKRAIRMLFYSKPSCALLTLHYVYKKKNGELVRRFLWQEQTVSTWVAPAQRKSNARHVDLRSLRWRFFFFCMRTPRRTCVHFVGLAYMYAKNVR